MYIFKPYYKSVIWGGDKICRLKGEMPPTSSIGECWEISAMPGCESVVADGPDRGLTLSELVSREGESLLGKDIFEKYNGQFPLLLKIIDAKRDLSVQVHPGQQMARELHNCSGKTEMWYIVDHEPGAKLYNGLSRRLSPNEYCSLVEDKKIMDAVQMHTVSKGDVYYVPSGRIHSIGAGNLLVEVQQPSDITYRVFDFDRPDANGKPRELHTELAAKAIDFNVYSDYPIDYDKNAASVKLLESDYFSVHRIQTAGTDVDFTIPGSTCAIAICTEGECQISAGGDVRTLTRLHSALVPASAKSLKISGDAVVLLAIPR